MAKKQIKNVQLEASEFNPNIKNFVINVNDEVYYASFDKEALTGVIQLEMDNKKYILNGSFEELVQ